MIVEKQCLKKDIFIKVCSIMTGTSASYVMTLKILISENI